MSYGCSNLCDEYSCTHLACLGCAALRKYCLTQHQQHRRSLQSTSSSQGVIDFHAVGGKLYANGEPFLIKGINWFGSESRSGPPLGLDRHNISYYMAFLREHRFNAIRFLFNHRTVLDNATLESPDTETYGPNAAWEAPELEGYKYVDMFLKLAQVAAEHGILVMMACHRLYPTGWPGNGLWYNSHKGVSEASVLESWTRLARKLCKQWNVFAVDLMNEPHRASWGLDDERTDWGRAATRIGNHVLSQCPRWLIMVEGVAERTKDVDVDDGFLWGENLLAAKEHPVRLRDQKKLCYAPHTYGPSVYGHDYFNDPSFPDNMPTLWHDRFAYLQAEHIAPIVVGEFGGRYEYKDRKWQDAFVAFLRSQQIGFFYFALIVDMEAQGVRHDTTGLLVDAKEANTEVLELLATAPSSDVFLAQQRVPPSPPMRPPKGPPPEPPPPPSPRCPSPWPPQLPHSPYSPSPLRPAETALSSPPMPSFPLPSPLPSPAPTPRPPARYLPPLMQPTNHPFALLQGADPMLMLIFAANILLALLVWAVCCIRGTFHDSDNTRKPASEKGAARDTGSGKRSSKPRTATEGSAATRRCRATIPSKPSTKMSRWRKEYGFDRISSIGADECHPEVESGKHSSSGSSRFGDARAKVRDSTRDVGRAPRRPRPG